MKYFSLPKDKLSEFIREIKNECTVVGPKPKENLFVFDVIDDPSEMTLDYLPTILPPKKYFFPQSEKLGSFSVGANSFSKTEVELKPMVLFGVHTCDVEGIECLDIVFSADPKDPYYAKREQSMIIIGYECMKPCDEHATCVTMGTHNPKAGYDCMMTDAGDKYILYVNSHRGLALLEKCKTLQPEKNKGEFVEVLNDLRQKKADVFKASLDASYYELKDVFKKTYQSKTWEGEVGKRCVSCGNCTAVCPTCYCFDIKDNLTLDLKEGTRDRTWDSCQLEEFAEVAGGENFREERASRQRHRYHRKFDYSVQKFNKYFCVGCGRCTRSCMAKISLIETVNTLTKESKNG